MWYRTDGGQEDTKGVEKMTNRIYGYARVSTKTQRLKRQVDNLKKHDKEILIYQEAYIGTSTARPEWSKLQKKLKAGDTVVFDSVSRMSRNSAEGIKEYKQMMDKGVNLVFLKEGYINSEVIERSISQAQGFKVKAMGEKIIDRSNDFIKDILMIQIENQIEIAFDQAEKEVMDLKERTKEGIRAARIKGSQIGRKEGSKFKTKRGQELKEKIRKCSRAFGGGMTDKEFIEAYKCSKSTFVKYKREIREE